ncbi:hypothetical protein LEP1GSC116_3515, partial [Leptospira interrogans serovar Icterohaemorrhagiae str. Verdun HP]
MLATFQKFFQLKFSKIQKSKIAKSDILFQNQNKSLFMKGVSFLF